MFKLDTKDTSWTNLIYFNFWESMFVLLLYFDIYM